MPTKKKIAFWRRKSSGIESSRYSLWTLTQIGKAKKIEGLSSYGSWDNPRAEEASEKIAVKIEQDAQDMGFEIVENPID